ncbi:MAG: hypothetical protein RLZZ131_261 [Actinomycetota bacterium]
MTARKKVAVICGGESPEHEISCLSGLGIFAAIDKDKYEAILLGISDEGRRFIELKSREDFGSDENGLPVIPKNGVFSEIPPDVDLLFPILHGTNGEDGVFQRFATEQGFNYVGSGISASQMAMDKSMAKEAFSEKGLITARGVTISRHDRTKREWQNLHYPLFVKPSRGGSSRGTIKVKREEDIESALDEAFRYDEKVLVEEAVVGREIECGILVQGGEVKSSVVGEIRVLGGREFYDYEAKYLDNATQYLVPAPIDEIASEIIREQAIRAFKALGCEGFARVDFFLKESGEVVINEINTLPGFTPKSVFPMLWKASGKSYEEVVSLLIEEALAFPKSK